MAPLLNTLRAKARSKSGESLVEALVAVLVSGLAMLMLSMAVTSSANIISKGADTARDYYEASNGLVEMSHTTDGTVKVTDNLVSADSHTEIDVEYSKEDLPGGETGVSYEQSSS